MNRLLSLGDTPKHLYLDLLKNTLTFALWPEPPALVRVNAPNRKLPKQLAVSVLVRAVELMGLRLVREVTPTWPERRDGVIWPRYAHTMVGLTRLNHLHGCLETIVRESIPGDVIETGVWRGGVCIFMRGFLAAHGITDRKVYVADSFCGYPPPEYPQDVHEAGDPYLVVPLSEVRENFRNFGLLDDQVVFLSGWFKDTLPLAPIDQLAILRLDGNMYGSTMDALAALYPKLALGGFCIVDDFDAVPECRQAVMDFRARYGIAAAIHKIDWACSFWRKDVVDLR